MSKEPTSIEDVKLELIEKFHASIVGGTVGEKKHLLFAYQQGLNDALNWVKKYNEEHTPKRIITK